MAKPLKAPRAEGYRKMSTKDVLSTTVDVLQHKKGDLLQVAAAFHRLVYIRPAELQVVARRLTESGVDKNMRTSTFLCNGRAISTKLRNMAAACEWFAQAGVPFLTAVQDKHVHEYLMSQVKRIGASGQRLSELRSTPCSHTRIQRWS